MTTTPSDRTLRIAMTADPDIPVPPLYYGGIERVIALLIEGLLERGHEVTLFAHPDSLVPCTLHPYPGTDSSSRRDTVRNMWHISNRILRGEYHIVHSFGRLAYLLPLLPLKLPKLMSYQREITKRSVKVAQRLGRNTLRFTGCSHHLITPFNQTNGDYWHVVYNAVPQKRYKYQPRVACDAPLIFLGRIEEIKGVHLAIEVARQSKRRLIIAGNVPEDADHHRYFDEKIKPHIDGKTIEYVGAVNDEQKNQLLGEAAALLMPILWEEPFGIVMAEALACGTPVMGLKRGSVPEIVQNGINGYVCHDVDEMVCAVQHLEKIDRHDCRRSMEERFSDHAVISEYEKIYSTLIGGTE